MSFLGAGNTSDVEQDKGLSDYRLSRSNNNLGPKPTTSKFADVLWNNKNDDSDSEISDSGNFLAKGAFLITPSHELSLERAAMICEKMNFKGCFSLTKTATGILFKFSHPEDYQAVYKKGFHKVTNARFYRKIPVPCRPQKTFTLFVFDVPEDIPIEDVRHSLYRFNSVVEVVRLILHPQNEPVAPAPTVAKEREEEANQREFPPSPIRITLASLDEYNILLQNGLDFYGATFFPTEANLELTGPVRIATKKGSRMIDGTLPGRVRELLPVFDATGFCKIPPPASKTIKPRP
ncbi:uncharacterized protein LOC129566380 isoform X2 [Sitodiplosis mosellana]|uniref:uncharacterized protein LOC129566380 isoform X2 n=1 Tax=Sitodiplosis mosellana TaxID=263140 RepID=UPI002443EAAA|nr:uncharacterized protein LOC129566380 isoform X2 [Sitodiplosis mosellana]